MYSFDRFVKEFFRLFDYFISKKYITEENRFIRDRKMTQKEHTAYILSQRSCTGYIETIRFFTIMMKKDFKTVKHVKPDASRKDSSEFYVVALGFRRDDETRTD